MKASIRIILWCVVFFIGFVALTKLDKWVQDEDAKTKPVFIYNPYITHG